MLRTPSLSTFSAAYSVVDLPEPVGPVTSTAPFGLAIALEKRFNSSSFIPSASSPSTLTPPSRMRITTPSP